MKKLILILIISISFPFFSFADTDNLGIIEGIWFSENEYFVGDIIRIYTAVQNHSGHDISGEVEFFDNNISIGKESFTSVDNRITELWIDTIAGEGEHSFSVEITTVEGSKPGGVVRALSPRVVRSIDALVIELDTDGDDVPDSEDEDDDNDGFSDVEEEEVGTDSLDKNEYPVSNEENNSSYSDSESSFVQDVLGILNLGNNPEDKTDVLPEVDEDVRVESPSFVENITSTYPVIETVTQPINTLQNVVVKRAEKAHKGNVAKLTEITVRGIELGEVVEENRISESQPKNWKYWILLMYGYFLQFISWIFSCLICTIILLFVLLHIVLKMLFAIGRKLIRK